VQVVPATQAPLPVHPLPSHCEYCAKVPAEATALEVDVAFVEVLLVVVFFVDVEVVFALLVVVFKVLLVVYVLLVVFLVLLVVLTLLVVVFTLDVVVFVLLVVVFLVVVELFDELTVSPSASHGKSNSAMLAMFVQKYSELPLEPTNCVPVA
jgi:hypothetical protein